MHFRLGFWAENIHSCRFRHWRLIVPMDQSGKSCWYGHDILLPPKVFYTLFRAVACVACHIRSSGSTLLAFCLRRVRCPILDDTIKIGSPQAIRFVRFAVFRVNTWPCPCIIGTTVKSCLVVTTVTILGVGVTYSSDQICYHVQLVAWRGPLRGLAPLLSALVRLIWLLPNPGG